MAKATTQTQTQAPKSAIVPPEFKNRVAAGCLTLEAPVKGAPQVIIYRLVGDDFIAFIDQASTHARVMKLFPRIVLPAQDGSPTGEILDAKDISAMRSEDVDAIDDFIVELIDLNNARDYEPEDDFYTLQFPVDLGVSTVRRLQFVPNRSFGEIKRYTKAGTPSDKLRAFMETMAVDPDNPDIPLSASFIARIDGADLARIMSGFLGRKTKKSTKLQRF
jgi:hypothetical protein